MKSDFFKTNWQVIIYNLIIILIFTIFYGHFGDITVDSFREAYIPEQILQGELLYKNILTIYAPFSYLFNAFLYHIFGVNLNVLYISALITTLCIFNLIFLIAKQFLPKNYALGIIIFCIATSVLSPNVFNFFFPYSFGMLYGLMFILGSIYCLLIKRNVYAFIFYALAVCNKYEFILFLSILLYANGKKNLLKNISIGIIVTFLVFIPLFINKLKVNDIIMSIQVLMLMSSTKTLYWFYMVTGLVFQPKLIPVYVENIFKTSLPAACLQFCKNKLFLPLIIIYSYFFLNQEVFICLFPLILFLFAFNYKKLNKRKIIFIFGSLLISIKVFFALTLQSYGIYFLPFALISFFILIPHKFKKNFLVILLIFSLTFGIKNISQLIQKNTLIKTHKGIIYTTPFYGNSINELIFYVNKNTTPKEQVLIYPECLAVNFLTDRASDNKFYSLIPLYVETFGEDILIKHFEITKPKHIIISNFSTSQYYFSFFGQDYAEKIYYYILNNYNLHKTIGKGLIFSSYIKK